MSYYWEYLYSVSYLNVNTKSMQAIILSVVSYEWESWFSILRKMIIIIIIMLMGWDYVSELLPTKGILFISQVIYEHGQTW
jgi:hypothetical protein